MSVKYSVIIPAYNAENTIHRCLDSLLKQNYEDMEIIVVNDGSKDNTHKICSEYAKINSCIKYSYHENQGVSKTRNLGISISSGKYIIFVDSDDYVSSNLFEVLDNISKTECDLYLYAYSVVSNKGITEHFYKEYMSLKQKDSLRKASELICNKSINAPWGKLYKGDIIRNNHIIFTEGASIAEDRAFNIKYSLYINSIGIVNENLYYLDVTNEDSLSRKKLSNREEQFKIADDDIQNALKNSNLEKKYLKYFYSSIDFGIYRSVYTKSKHMHIEENVWIDRYKELLKMCNEISQKYQPCYLNMYCALISLSVKFRVIPLIDLMGKRLSK